MMEVSSLVRAAMIARLSHPTTGFNALLAARAASFGVSPFALNWSNDSRNFFRFLIDPDELESSDEIQYPLAVLHVQRSRNRNRVKFQVFSGDVDALFMVHISTLPTRQPDEAFAALADCVESVAYDVFNATEAQNWASPVIYNGEMDCSVSHAVNRGELWRATLTFTLHFGVNE